MKIFLRRIIYNFIINFNPPQLLYKTAFIINVNSCDTSENDVRNIAIEIINKFTEDTKFLG